MNLHLKQVYLLLVASLALTRTSLADPSQTNTNINEIDDKIPEKPEPRQIGGVMPYTWLQPPQSVVAAAAAPILPSSWGVSTPSWWSSLGNGQSFLSLFRPNVVGGRRSSLTSRLRNLMNALFYRRETTSPYLTSGSSYSYSFRPPPFGFSSGFPTTGLTSALGNQNLYGSASLNRPVVLSNYGSSPAVDAWSNYKQYGSGSSLPASWGSGGSGTGSSSGALWQSGSSSGTGPQYSALGSSSFPSFSSGSGSSNSAYQAAASNVYPQTSYQRSSISTYSKPQPQPSTSVSSSVSVSSSSSSSSQQNPKSIGF